MGKPIPPFSSRFLSSFEGAAITSTFCLFAPTPVDAAKPLRHALPSVHDHPRGAGIIPRDHARSASRSTNLFWHRLRHQSSAAWVLQGAPSRPCVDGLRRQDENGLLPAFFVQPVHADLVVFSSRCRKRHELKGQQLVTRACSVDCLINRPERPSAQYHDQMSRAVHRHAYERASVGSAISGRIIPLPQIRRKISARNHLHQPPGE